MFFEKYGESNKESNFTGLLLVDVFAKVAKVNTETLNIKFCQPRQNVFSYSHLSILFAAAKNDEIYIYKLSLILTNSVKSKKILLLITF